MAETFSQRIKDDVARFVADPTRDGLQELIRFFGGEFDQYELKESWPPIPRMAKTALAIANSGGGVIIFGIADATLEPIGLTEFMSKQQVFETFRSFVPGELLNEITLLDFDYANADYEPIRGKLIQVLAIPDVPHALPFVCEDEWHQDDHHVRRGAIYVRSGTNTRDTDYRQLQQMLERRIGSADPVRSAHHLAEELAELHALYVARARAISEPTAGEHVLDGLNAERVSESFRDMADFIGELIDARKRQIADMLGLHSEDALPR
jgi:predicted HTH transcriptional regulator